MDRPDILVRIYVQDRKTGEGTDLTQDTSMGGQGTTLHIIHTQHPNLSEKIQFNRISFWWKGKNSRP